MKNLFTHEILSDDDERYVPYENPYLVSRVSPETEAIMNYDPEADAPEINEDEQKAAKSKEGRYLILALVSFVLMFGSLIFIFSSNSFLLTTPVAMLPLGFLCAAFIFIYLSKQRQWEKNSASSLKDVDFEAMAARMGEASKAARAEMGIPDDDVSVEILPYGYKKKGDKQVPEKKANQFDNTPLSMHVKDGKLCIFDSVGLYEIPLSDIKGYRVYDEDYRIEFWLKEEEPTDEKYGAYKLKKCGLFEYKTHTYYGVEVVSEATGETFEMLVPGYDLEELKKVIDIEAVA